jgi:hypothetical protein
VCTNACHVSMRVFQLSDFRMFEYLLDYRVSATLDLADASSNPCTLTCICECYTDNDTWWYRSEILDAMKGRSIAFLGDSLTRQVRARVVSG